MERVTAWVNAEAQKHLPCAQDGIEGMQANLQKLVEQGITYLVHSGSVHHTAALFACHNCYRYNIVANHLLFMQLLHNCRYILLYLLFITLCVINIHQGITSI